MTKRVRRRFSHIWTSTVLVMAATAGCDPTPVFRIQSDRNSGIPFFPLIAVDKETVMFEQSWLRLDATIATDPAEGSQAARTSASITLFSSDDKSGAGVQALVGELGRLTTASEVLGKLNAAPGFSYAPPGVEMISDLAAEEPAPHLHRIGRTLEVTQEVSAEPAYINVMTPHVGSANAEIKLTDRGVLADSSGQRQDQLPGAIASMVGTLGSAATSALLTPAAAAAPTGSSSAVATVRESGPVTARPTPRRKEPAISVAITVTPMRRTYTITRYWIPTARSPMGDLVSGCAQSKDCRMELRVSEIEVALKVGSSTDKTAEKDTNK